MKARTLFFVTALLAAMTAAAQDTPDHSAWGTADGADGSAEKPYVITTTAGLDLLASEVNRGGDFYQKYFVLGADITYSHETDWNDDSSDENNFTPIGPGFWAFGGIFDGQGHTIRGIRIYSTEGDQGLFGSINEGTVRNVILADARITGHHAVGGIAGWNGGTVENCCVAPDVFIGIAGDDPSNHGGIAGDNGGTVDGCSSAATLAPAGASGGIVGHHQGGTVSNCRAVGARLYYNYNSNVGIIVGDNDEGTLSHNYYYDCSIVPNEWEVRTENIGIGKDNRHEDLTDNDGAVRTEYIPLFDNSSNASLIALCSSRTDEYGDPMRASYTLTGRTLYKDGSWNTLCLPFELRGWSNIINYLDSPANIMELTSTTFEDGVLTLTFEEIDRNFGMQPGKPYIVRWNRADDYVDDNDHNLYQPTFFDMGASTATSPSTTDYVDFIGSCDPVTLAAGDRTVLYLGADNMLYWPSDAVTLGSCRGYFQLKNGLAMGDGEGGVKAFVLNLGDGIPGSWDGMDGLTSSPLGEGGAGAAVSSAKGLRGTFDLTGRRVGNGKRQHGLYVRDGRKVVE